MIELHPAKARHDNAPAPWSQTPESLFAELGSGPAGLSLAAAAQRLKRDGPNSVEDESRLSAIVLLIRQVRNPLSLILLFAALIAALTGSTLEALIILAIVLGSCLLGFAQEYRASAAVLALRQRLALSARVRRAGDVVTTPFSDIVVGDVVLLSAGAVAPADAVVLSARDLLLSEAALTGESFPVEKRPGTVAAEAAMPARSNMVFLGSSVRSGTGEALVVATGRNTAFGAIAERLKTKPQETDFARGVARFGAMLIRIMIVVVLGVLIANQLLGRPFLNSLLFAVALGVGLSPELLPAIISVTLSAGARRLAEKGVIVRRLEAIENLGGMTVFCTDKTGTLTTGVVGLEAVVEPTGAASATVGQLAFLNSALETGIENPLDQAVVAWGKAKGLATHGYLKVDEIPYDFSRKRLTVVVQTPDDLKTRLMISKGAVASILPLCRTWAAPGGPAAFDAKGRAAVDAYFRRKSEEGFRVLAVASRRMAVRDDYVVADEDGMLLEGLLVFMDPPKPEAAQAVRDLAALGVTVKVLSGDNRHVVAYVGRSLGLDAAHVVTGEDLARLRDEALWNLVERTTLFAEVDPQAKERIVRALQRIGHSVGYLGDGINDAPSLHAADVGVSVDQAVDVARQSADVVLLRADLDVLRQGVEGGRRAFANTLKYIGITISANFGNMVSMALATPLLPFLPMAAKQILLNNLLSDIPAVAIASDTVDQAQIATAQRIGVRDIQTFMVLFGLISSAFDLVTFAVLLKLFRASEPIFQTAWFVVSLLTELAVLLVLRTHGPAWRSKPGRMLTLLTIAVALLALASPYLGPLSALFGLVPLSLPVMATLVAIVLGYAAASEAGKLWFFGRRRHPAPKGRPGRAGERSLA